MSKPLPRLTCTISEQPFRVQVTTGCLDDLIGHKLHIWAQIQQAQNDADLAACEALISDMAYKLGFIDVCDYHVSRLCDAVLQRRCELLTTHYPTQE